MILRIDSTILSLKLKIPPGKKDKFVIWQAELNVSIVDSFGFISLEIVCPTNSGDWKLVLRFIEDRSLKKWFQSSKYQLLIDKCAL